MIARNLSISAVSALLSVGICAYCASPNGPTKPVPQPIRTVDYTPLPADAPLHHRTKWSDEAFLYIDDDAAAPSVFVFDPSGKLKFSALIQISRVNRIRLDDYAAAPDGSVWTGGSAISATGQRSYFLAHISPGGTGIQVIQTNPYHPREVSVAPDGTLWTAGYAVVPDAKGGGHQDAKQEVLRHFDSSGRLVSAAMPAGGVGPMRAADGFLVAQQDRIGWYSPDYGTGEYLELAPDMKVLHSYPVAHGGDKFSRTEGFVLTPSGRVFATVAHAGGNGPSSTLYELDRAANTWVAVDIPRNASGNIPWLEGNDRESLVFTPEYSKLQLFDLPNR